MRDWIKDSKSILYISDLADNAYRNYTTKGTDAIGMSRPLVNFGKHSEWHGIDMSTRQGGHMPINKGMN